MNNFPDFSNSGYQVVRELGRNHLGGRVTYLATDVKTQKSVVIKEFQFARSGSTWTDYDAHDREIQTLRGLDHPGIPRYLDSFQTLDGFCMVQEYKDATSLAEMRSFSPDEIKQIAVAALKILAYLQNRVPPVIHRDVKPENILVDDQINVYLVDFGFARVGDGQVGISSVVKGTLGFMPPEQLFNRQLTEASDLYGLGVTLICLLTNTKSTNVGNLIDITYRVNFRSLVPKLSAGWVSWLEKMVEPRVEDRYPNAIEALASLPIYPLRSPEARLNQSSLDLIATRPGERLFHTIEISNSVPKTILEGTWEVAPHPSDPPHCPSSHSWISFHPLVFQGNQTECRITVDTTKLMRNKTFNRKILLHTNTLEQTYTLELRVKTAPLAMQTKSLPYGLLVLLFSFSFLASWVTAWFALFVGAVEGVVAVTWFGVAIGAAVGFEIAAWIMGTLASTAGATTGVIAGFAVGSMALLLPAIEALSVDSMTVLPGAIAGFMSGALTGLVAGFVVEKTTAKGISLGAGVTIALLTMASGFSLGLSFVLGLSKPLYISAVVGINVLMAAVIVQGLLQGIRLAAYSRRSEQRLIKP
ncbi:protein kinase [Kovacikia minuta CCNUW1]|uniref:serine/threonine-protein kinase n=1 Tax=Kovacikia minuta TaxID=2931930 RepID=UPI001CCCA6A5|nr:serine/threonine-protein kinase [Kovacikia minuta]UBF29190.1 protein kinase [Kovacikia minuta CCNUW1]